MFIDTSLRGLFFKPWQSFIILLCFIVNTFGFMPPALSDEFRLPAPGSMVYLSPGFVPAHLQGLTIHPEDPLKLDFLIHKGDAHLTNAQKKEEYIILVKYFLASLAVPDKDQWVNLSPYEHNRIIADDFGRTTMGRDLLEEDYLLKQITSSLMYPESGLGKAFWSMVYARAWQQFHVSNIPVNAFNKVWIVPDEAVVFESGNTAFIIKSHLKVMLEEDYLSLYKHGGRKTDDRHSISSKIIKQIIFPALEKEVNEGKNFAMLRQMVSAMILATWYKKALKDSVLGQIYADRSRLIGISQDPKLNEVIYQKYLSAFKKGVYNYIKEDESQYTHQLVPRKYFSGGFKNAAQVVIDRKLAGADLDAAQALWRQASSIDRAMVDLTPLPARQKRFLNFNNILKLKDGNDTQLWSLIKKRYPHGQVKVIELIGRLDDLVLQVLSETMGLTENDAVLLSASVEENGTRIHLMVAAKAGFFKDETSVRNILADRHRPVSDFLVYFKENPALKNIHLDYIACHKDLRHQWNMEEIFKNIENDLRINFPGYSLTAWPIEPQVESFMGFFPSNISFKFPVSAVQQYVRRNFEGTNNIEGRWIPPSSPEFISIEQISRKLDDMFSRMKNLKNQDSLQKATYTADLLPIGEVLAENTLKAISFINKTQLEIQGSIEHLDVKGFDDELRLQYTSLLVKIALNTVSRGSGEFQDFIEEKLSQMPNSDVQEVIRQIIARAVPYALDNFLLGNVLLDLPVLVKPLDGLKELASLQEQVGNVSLNLNVLNPSASNPVLMLVKEPLGQYSPRLRRYASIIGYSRGLSPSLKINAQDTERARELARLGISSFIFTVEKGTGSVELGLFLSQNAYWKYFRDHSNAGQASIEAVLRKSGVLLNPAISFDAPGGIDLSSGNITVRGGGGRIKFRIDASMVRQLQDTPGFVPVMTNIQPMGDFYALLGRSPNVVNTAKALPGLTPAVLITGK